MSGALEPTDEPGFRTLKRALFVAALLTNGLLLWHFHDRYWYPTDDGLYAHVAQRLLEGEVLNRDIQDIHPGYIHMPSACHLPPRRQVQHRRIAVRDGFRQVTLRPHGND